MNLNLPGRGLVLPSAPTHLIQKAAHQNYDPDEEERAKKLAESAYVQVGYDEEDDPYDIEAIKAGRVKPKQKKLQAERELPKGKGKKKEKGKGKANDVPPLPKPDGAEEVGEQASAAPGNAPRPPKSKKKVAPLEGEEVEGKKKKNKKKKKAKDGDDGGDTQDADVEKKNKSKKEKKKKQAQEQNSGDAVDGGEVGEKKKKHKRPPVEKVPIPEEEGLIMGVPVPANKVLLFLCVAINFNPRSAGLGTLAANFAGQRDPKGLVILIALVQFAFSFAILGFIWSAGWAILMVGSYKKMDMNRKKIKRLAEEAEAERERIAKEKEEADEAMRKAWEEQEAERKRLEEEAVEKAKKEKPDLHVEMLMGRTFVQRANPLQSNFNPSHQGVEAPSDVQPNL